MSEQGARRAAAVSIALPAPSRMAVPGGELRLTSDTRILTPASEHPAWLDQAAWLLADLVEGVTGWRPQVATSPAGPGDVELVHGAESPGPGPVPKTWPERYQLEIADSVRIESAGRAGLLNGVHVLWQLLGSDGTLVRARIQDEPQLPWRGLGLDVARHFMPKPFVLKVIDAMALVRLNRLHLHLSDDQGWRLPVEGYPRLTGVGATRSATMAGHLSKDDDQESIVLDGRPHCGCYTRADIAEIVAHAERHGIVVVPEVDMPGHMSAAIAAYPELGVNRELTKPLPSWGIHPNVLNLEDATLEFVLAVVTELTEQFPGQWIHLGGDECPTSQWESDERTHERMRELGIDSVQHIQNWILALAAGPVRQHGRTLVGYDELLDHGSMPADTLIVAWRDDAQALRGLRAGYQVVQASSERLYLDYYQSSDSREPLAIGGLTTLRDVYQAELVPAAATAQERDRLVGAQVTLWTEYVPTPEHAAYMIFPRLWAFAENAWGTGGSAGTPMADLERRLRANLPRLTDIGLGGRSLDRTDPQPAATGGQLGERELG